MDGKGRRGWDRSVEDGIGAEGIGEAVMDWRGMDRTREDRRGKAGV